MSITFFHNDGSNIDIRLNKFLCYSPKLDLSDYEQGNLSINFTGEEFRNFLIAMDVNINDVYKMTLNPDEERSVTMIIDYLEPEENKIVEIEQPVDDPDLSDRIDNVLIIFNGVESLECENNIEGFSCLCKNNLLVNLAIFVAIIIILILCFRAFKGNFSIKFQ